MPDEAFQSDVVVIGAGPAGCAAASRCAEEGLRVIIVERARFPRYRPGETLHPGAETILRALGVWKRVEALDPPRHDGIWVRWLGAERFEPFGADARGPWQGIQAWRADLDRILLDAARRAGATVLQPAVAHDVLLQDGVVRGVTTSAGRICANLVIDASGGCHWVARKIGLNVAAVSRRLIARYGYARGRCPAADRAPRFSADTRGWTWMARVKKNTYAWVAVASTGSVRDPLCPDCLEQLECGRVRAADVTWRATSRAAGPGYLLAGDAAFVIDPASSHGVLRAMMAGVLAADTAVRTFADPARAPELAWNYDRCMHDWFAYDAKRLSELYRCAFWQGPLSGPNHYYNQKE